MHERVAVILLGTVAGCSLGAIALIAAFLAYECVPLAMSWWRTLDAWSTAPPAGFVPSLLFSTDWLPASEPPRFGFLPLAVGTAKVSLVAVALAAPVGICAAMYTSWIAPRWVQTIVKPVVELLAGVPTVIIGYLALVALAGPLQELLGYTYRLNGLLGGVALSVAVVPIIFTLAEDAMRRVPGSLMEAGLSLGAGRWEALVSIVVPAAAPGIVAAVLLGLGRAVGETMIVLMVTGNAPLHTVSLADPVRTIAGTLGSEMGTAVSGELHYHVLFLLAASLFVCTYGINAAAGSVLRRLGGFAERTHRW